MSCISDIIKMFRAIEQEDTTVNADLPEGKLLKFNDHDIHAEELANLFKSKNIPESKIDAISAKMGPLNKKLRGLDYVSLSKLSKVTNHLKDPNKVVPYSIALKELLDTQKSEYNKLLKQTSDLKITKISDDGIMNVGLARSAAVIGRKFLYTQGYRIRSNPEEKVYISPVNIEAKEYEIGLSILEDMKKEGLVEIVEDNIINDFYKEEGNNGKSKVLKAPVARPLLENMIDDADFTANADVYKKILRGEINSDREEDAPSTINDLQAIVNAVNVAKISPMESVPNTTEPTEEYMSKNDALNMTHNGKKFREHLATTPMYIHNSMVPLFTNLAKEWSESTKSFKAFMEDIAGSKTDYTSLNKSFGVNNVDDFAEDLIDSAYGQNKSKLDPLEAFLNNINKFVKEGKSNPLFMNYNIVRNARLNMDNSILNSQSSKFFRNTVVSNKTTLHLKKGEEEIVDHFIGSIMDRLGDLDIEFNGEEGSQELLDELLGNTANKKLEDALRHTELISGRAGSPSITNVIAYGDKYAKGNIAATITLLEGIKDLRTLINTGTVETSYNTMSDATASGGTISISASLGYDKKSYDTVKRLGLIEGTKGNLDDMYAILSEDLQNINNKEDTGDLERELSLVHSDIQGSKLLPQFLDIVYKNKMRDLSKDPTMTFIYNQKEKGAIRTIAINATETLLKDANNQNTLDYINQLVESTYTTDTILSEEASGIKKDLITALQDPKKSPIPFIRKRLESLVNPLVNRRQQIIEDLYKELNDKTNGNVNMVTPLATLDGKENTAKNRIVGKGYGMPLMKVQNILNKLDDKYVVTMENRPNSTTATVNTTHGQDMAIAAIALNDAVEEFKDLYPNEEVPGVTFVHDELVTSPKLGALIDSQYTKAFKEVVGDFSVEQQLLDHLEQIDPENRLIKEYKDEIAKANNEKKRILKSYSENPGKIYGNAKGHYNLNYTPSKPTPPKGPNKKDTKVTHTVVEPNIKSKTLYNKLSSLSKNSALIADFLKTNPKVLNKWKGEYLYNTEKDQIELGDESPINLSLRSKKETSDEHLKELVEHEITHAYTAAYIAKELSKPMENRDVKIQYIEKALNNLPDSFNDALDKGLSPDTAERIKYIKERPNIQSKMSEFVAIMNAEKEASNEIKEYFRKDKNDKTGLHTRWEKAIESLVSYIKKLIKVEPLDQVYVPALKDSIEGVIKEGKVYKESNYKEAIKVQKKAYSSLHAYADPLPEGFDPAKNYNKRDITRPEVVIGKTLDSMNSITKNLLINNLERAGDNIAKSADRFLNANFPMYADVRKRILGLYNESSLSSSLQSIADFVGITELSNKEIKQDLISTFHNIKEGRNEREHKYLKQIKDLTKNFTKEDNKELYELVTKVPLHNFFRYDDEFKSSKDITSEITELEKNLDEKVLRVVEDTVEFLNDGKVRENTIYNLNDYGEGSKVYKNIEKLIALKSLEKSGLSDTIINLRNDHPKLYSVMKDNSLALYMLSKKLHGMSPKGSLATNTLVKEQYKHRLTYKVFELKDRHLYDSGENLGYTIIKEPTEATLGVVSTKTLDDTFTTGAGILEDLPNQDIIVPEHLTVSYNLLENNMLKAGDKTKLILSHEEKLKAGLIEDMGSTLIKSTANIIAADDSQYIRNKLMEQGLRTVVKSENDDSIQEIVDKIDSDLIDHPYVLKLEDGVRFDKLPKKIRDKYKPIQQNLSSIGGFNENITHVRKDIRHWLIGGHVPSLFKNPKLQRMSTLVKEAIAGSKIGMVMVNPKKIMADLVSNDTHLSLLGVPASFILRTQKDILKDIDSLNIIKNGILEYELKAKAMPTEQNKSNLKKLEDKLLHHPLYTAHKNAYMSSLSSDILSSDASTTEGLQADLEAGIKYMLIDNKGNKNALHKIIGTASRFGMNGTDVLRGISKVTDTMNSDKEISKSLNGIADRIDELKNDDDMVKYLSQYTISPDAETVKAGTLANNIADLLMRETYRRYLIDKGTTPAKANEKAIAMAPFYPEDMPLGVKMLSDYFIVPFASWTLRVHQPVMYIFKNRVGTLATEELIAKMLEADLEIYAASHPFEKILNGTLTESPTSEIGLQSVLPTNLFNF